VLLVDAVRGDETAQVIETEVVDAAKRRQRRLGAVACVGGRTTLHLVSLYCEVAILCDVERAFRLGLSDEELAGHLMVLWGVVPDHGSAMAAVAGTGPPIFERLVRGAHERVAGDAFDDGELSKGEALAMLWRVRGASDGVAVPGSGRFRDALLPGSRVEELKLGAVRQLTSSWSSPAPLPDMTAG
jgi:hypothetical protein